MSIANRGQRRLHFLSGAAFFLAGLAVLALVLQRRRLHAPGIHLGHCGGSLVLSISPIFAVVQVPKINAEGTM